MPEEIVTRILRLPEYGIYAWEADEAANTLTLASRQTAEHPYYVCGGCGISVREVQGEDGMKRLASRSTWWHICPTRVNAVDVAERRGQPWIILASTCTRGKVRSVCWLRGAN